ncbi:MAG: EF-P lysine aminoacylase EpmA [Enterobacterales bacterium]|nr:EF-P lysine aminoacylase EpmA [Enterobacterales bacterium]
MEIRKKLEQRNLLLSQVRGFFEQKKILEVDTPLIRKFSVTDPYMRAFSVLSASGTHRGFLQTSPEYAMKELLSLGSGDIFQLGKMFRCDEKGANHHTEFTLLEWYRVGWDQYALMDECAELLHSVLGPLPVFSTSYAEAFISQLGHDPLGISLQRLQQLAATQLGELPKDLLFDDYLSLLFSEKIEPSFNPKQITFVTDFPKSQASLAKTRINSQGVEVAERFEIYVGGLELANGFYELTDANQQAARFKRDNELRAASGWLKLRSMIS